MTKWMDFEFDQVLGPLLSQRETKSPWVGANGSDEEQEFDGGSEALGGVSRRMYSKERRPARKAGPISNPHTTDMDVRSSTSASYPDPEVGESP